MIECVIKTEHLKKIGLTVLLFLEKIFVVFDYFFENGECF